MVKLQQPAASRLTGACTDSPVHSRSTAETKTTAAQQLREVPQPVNWHRRIPSKLNDIDDGLDVARGAVSPDAHDRHQEAQAGQARGRHLLLEEALDLAADLLPVHAAVGPRVLLLLLLLLLGAPVARRVAVGVGADHVVAHLHPAGGGPVLPAGGRMLPLGRGRGRGRRGLRLGEQVRRDEVGHGEAGQGNQRGRVQQVGMADGPGGQGEGEEEGGARDAGEGSQVRPRRGGQGSEGLRGCARGRKGEEGWDGEGRECVGEALLRKIWSLASRRLEVVDIGLCKAASMVLCCRGSFGGMKSSST